MAHDCVAGWVANEIAEFEPDALLFGAPHPLPAIIPKLRSEFAGPIAVMTHGAEVTLPAALPVRDSGCDARCGAPTCCWRCPVHGRQGWQADRAKWSRSGRASTSSRSPPLIDRAAPVIGCVSRFVPRKGQDRLIEVAGQLRQTGIPVELILVGKGRWESRLRRLADARQVPTRFEVDVPWETLARALSEMAVFAMPAKSRWAGLEVEGLGIVYLEAAAAGLPVVAGDSGGAPEAVLPGVTGFVSHDDTTLESAIRTLIEDQTSRPKWAPQAGNGWRKTTPGLRSQTASKPP